MAHGLEVSVVRFLGIPFDKIPMKPDTGQIG